MFLESITGITIVLASFNLFLTEGITSKSKITCFLIQRHLP